MAEGSPGDIQDPWCQPAQALFRAGGSSVQSFRVTGPQFPRVGSPWRLLTLGCLD